MTGIRKYDPLYDAKVALGRLREHYFDGGRMDGEASPVLGAATLAMIAAFGSFIIAGVGAIVGLGAVETVFALLTMALLFGVGIPLFLLDIVLALLGGVYDVGRTSVAAVASRMPHQ